MREKLIDILEWYADFLDWERKEDIVDRIMELFATDNNVGGKWIPVSERLPDAGTNVLVFCKGCDYSSILTFRHDRYGNLEFMYQDDCGYWRKAFRAEVTHWMPLPEPPKEGE